MKGRIKRTEPTQKLALPRVGNIRIGKKSEKGFPQSVDYFIPSGKYSELFTKAYGEKPQTIQIIFPDDDNKKVCLEHYEYRDDSGALVAEGDGEIFKVWSGTKYETLTIEDYPNLMQGISKKYPNKASRKDGDGWKINLTLNFMVPMVQGIAGVWQFSTNGSASTIPQIRETFDAMLQERGFIRGIIFDLNVKFATTQKPGDKSRFPVVSLVPNQSEENVNKIKDVLKFNNRIGHE
jgi:hypothetical protein